MLKTLSRYILLVSIFEGAKMKKFIRIFCVAVISLNVYFQSISMEDSHELDQEEIVYRILDCHEHSLTDKCPILVNDKISFWRKYYGICPAVNIVVNSSLSDEELADAAINYIKNRVKKLGGSVEWEILPTTTPSNIIGILEKNCFQLNHVLTVMIYYLDNMNEKLFVEFDSSEALKKENLVDPSISIKPLDIEMIPAWTDILAKVHGCEWCNDIPYREYIERGVINKTGRSYSAEYFAGYYDNQLANTSGLFIGSDYGCIYVTSTDELFRRKGLATQMTLTILKRAKILGLKYIILECNESIIPLYAKIGFKEVFEKRTSYLAMVIEFS